MYVNCHEALNPKHTILYNRKEKINVKMVSSLFMHIHTYIYVMKKRHENLTK